MTDAAWESLSNQAVAAAGLLYFLALLAHLVGERPASRGDRLADRHVAQRGPLDGVRQEGQEVDHPGRGHALVAQRLPLCVGHDSSSPLPCLSAATIPASSSRPVSGSPPDERSSRATSTSVVPSA